MPRIPDSEVQRLKQAVPLTRLAEARGVALKGQGHNLIGLCPFHDDRDRRCTGSTGGLRARRVPRGKRRSPHP